MREVHKEALESSGGVSIWWVKRVRKGELVEIGGQNLIRKFIGVREEFSWHITATYVDCSREIKKVLREELKAM